MIVDGLTVVYVSNPMKKQEELTNLNSCINRGYPQPDRPRMAEHVPTVFGVVMQRPKVTAHNHNLRDVAQRVADELTRTAATTDRPYQYASHLVRLGQELQMALEEVKA